MLKNEKAQKIILIIICSIVFATQIYYSVSYFITGLDMKTAYEKKDFSLVYNLHPNLLVSRIIIGLLPAQSLYVELLSAIMIVFLLLGSLNEIDLIYFGLLLVFIYLLRQHKNKALNKFIMASFLRILVLLIVIIIGGIRILSVFLIGNTSIENILLLGSRIIPIISVVLLILSSCSFAYYLYLEFRKS